MILPNTPDHPRTLERIVKRCIELSMRLGALEDRVPPAIGQELVECLDLVDEMQPWAEGRPASQESQERE